MLSMLIIVVFSPRPGTTRASEHPPDSCLRTSSRLVPQNIPQTRHDLTMAPLWTLLYRPTLVVAAVFLLYVFALSVYRLYFSPIAKFPGRRLAAVTLWYEFYYQVIKGGRYVWEVEKMHQEYGKSASLSAWC